MKTFWMHWRVTGALAAVLVACGAYWWLLLAQQQEQTTFAETQTELRATHIARTLAAQMETLMGGLEYLARSLAVLHEHDPQHTFQLAATDALASFPPGSILQIAVADSSGRIVYSSLSPDSATLGTSIGDRPHFQAHTLETEKRLYISRPTLGRVSGQWSVQVSYPISQGNRFGGVVVLSINPDYLSNNLRDVFTQGNDAALLLRADGAYLARSHGQKEVMALNVPADREFMRYPERTSGRYQVAAPIEDVHRFYAWQRLAHYPLVVSVGLSRDKAMAGTYQSVRDSRLRNAVGTLAFVLAACWIALLFQRQKQDRERLERQRQRYRLALEGGKLGTWTWSPPAGDFFFDRSWVRLLGLPKEAYHPNHEQLQALIHPEDWLAWRDALEAHVRGDSEFFEAEPRLRHQDGHWIWMQVRGRIVQRAGQPPSQRITGTYVDVTQRHEIDAARQELQQRLAKLLVQVPGTVFQFRLRPDGSSCFPYASPGIADIYGITPELAQTDSREAFASAHPEDLEALRSSTLESARTLELWSHEWRQVLPNGQIRWLAGQAKPEREADGSTLWHGYIHDVTEQHSVMEALRRSEARLRLTMVAVQDGLWEWDTRTGIIEMDKRCHQMLGYEVLSQKLNFQTWQEHVHPDDRHRVLTTLQRQIALGEPFDMETRLLTQQGTWRWMEIRGQVAPDDTEIAGLVIGTQTDITLRKQETHLRQALLDNAAAALLISTPERIIALANHRAVETFSQDGLPLQGKSLSVLHRHEAAFTQFLPYVDAVREQGGVEVEYLMRTATGALRWFSIRGTPLDPQQPEGDVIWTLVDTTERRETEEALATAQAHLMEVIRHFPGGVLVQNQVGTAVVLNQALCDLFGVSTLSEELVGCDRTKLRAMVPTEVLDALPPAEQLYTMGNNATYEVALAQGTTVRIDMVQIRTARGNDLGRLWLAQDISERRQRERTLERLATTDTLTGLTNRRAFMARLEAEITHIAHGAPPAAFLMLDLDHFKRVNDTWGHATGDKVLVHLANLLRGNLLRKEDMAGRLGGEEFAVLLPNTTVEQGHAIAERLRIALEQSTIASDDGQTIRVTMSVGLCPVLPDSASTLASSDAALYQAKNTGRNRVVRADTTKA